MQQSNMSYMEINFAFTSWFCCNNPVSPDGAGVVHGGSSWGTAVYKRDDEAKMCGALEIILRQQKWPTTQTSSNSLPTTQSLNTVPVTLYRPILWSRARTAYVISWSIQVLWSKRNLNAQGGKKGLHTDILSCWPLEVSSTTVQFPAFIVWPKWSHMKTDHERSWQLK